LEEDIRALNTDQDGQVTLKDNHPVSNKPAIHTLLEEPYLPPVLHHYFTLDADSLA
jgi:hypothetical protein